jgi:RNA ligase (TIGR02306 family)
MIWEIMRGKEFEETEKLDGTSLTIYRTWDRMKDEWKVGVCSRNIELEIDDANKEQNVYVKFVVESGLYDWMKDLRSDMQFAIQGELVGFGIQGNVYQLTDQRLYIFDVFDIDNQRYLEPNERIPIVILATELSDKIDHVPIITENVKILEEYSNMVSLLEHADGQSYINSHVIREGCVYKAMHGNMSFKVVSNKYLLKYGER